MDRDVLEGGGPPRAGSPRRLPRFRPPRLGPRGRWVAGIGAGLTAVLAITLLQRTAPEPVPVAAPSPSAPIAAPEPAPALAPPLPATGSSIGPGFLDPVAKWELFARTDTEVDRIQPLLARVTRTAVPRLLSTGPVSFLVTADRALVRPLDVVPGYEVPDGRPAREMPTALSPHGPVFPGPDPGHIWVPSGSSLVLRALDGGPDVARIVLPEDEPYQLVVVDGGGTLLVPGTSGVYEARPDGLRKLSTGALLAVGPRNWLVAECTDRHRCYSDLLDRATGARREIGPPVSVGPTVGAISPDGRTAAIYRTEDGGHVDLDLVDLASGEIRTADVELEQSVEPGMLAWSPDGRLFVIAAGGAIRMIDRDSGRAGPIGPPLPPVRQLAVRTTG
ncbi:MAG TPA: hypothetical protein VGP36_07895 [Mycobacteriales bacterium]|nr:hypothetical protein [Mycobacteriales bacterium]